MKKVLDFNVKEGRLEGRLVVEIKINKVESISAINIQKGVFEIVKIQGKLFSNEGKLLHSGNLSNLLPDNDEVAVLVKQLWKHNVGYCYGTLKQIECIGNLSFEDLAKDKNVLNNAVEKLKDNNLLIDRGISFGSTMLINPLPENLLSKINELLIA